MTPTDLPDDVSRETLHRQVFGERYPLAVAYAELLRLDGVQRGLLGPREAGRLWDRHLLNCAVVAPALPSEATVVDVGSGAGLPGLVWAIARPDLTVVLLEPLLRRATFLTEAVERLGLSRVSVVRARAEEARPALGDVVTARAVAPLDRLARWCLPLVRPGGSLLAIKGARAAVELAEAEPSLAGLGAASWAIEMYGEGFLDPPVPVIRVVVSTMSPTTERPTTERPTTERPTAERPTTRRLTADRSGGSSTASTPGHRRPPGPGGHLAGSEESP